MPELPAMENFRRSIETETLGKKVAAVKIIPSRVVRIEEKTLSKALLGKKIAEASRHGKHVFVRAGSGANAVWLAFHCGMTGYFTFPESGETDKTLGKAKLVLQFADGSALAFFDPRRFGRVEMIDNPKSFIATHALGPDAATVSENTLAALLAESGKPLKTFFLDQSLMAGIGNVYGDEIPFQAKLNPKRKAKSLTKAEAGRLHRALGGVLKTAIARKAYLDHWDMLPRSWLVHHREEGAACPRCGDAVEGYTAGGRSGYWSPGCQK